MIQKFPQQTRVLGSVISIGNGDYGNSEVINQYLPWANQGHVMGTFQFNIENCSVKLYGTNDNDSVADADAEWDDILMGIFGVAQETVSGQWIFNEPLVFARLKVEITTTNATNSFSLKITKLR